MSTKGNVKEKGFVWLTGYILSQGGQGRSLKQPGPSESQSRAERINKGTLSSVQLTLSVFTQSRIQTQGTTALTVDWVFPQGLMQSR